MTGEIAYYANLTLITLHNRMKVFSLTDLLQCLHVYCMLTAWCTALMKLTKMKPRTKENSKLEYRSEETCTRKNIHEFFVSMTNHSLYY